MSGLLGKLEGELRGSHEHAAELERQIKALQEAAKHVDHAQPNPRGGVDYAFPPHPSPAALRAAHATFACRYISGAGKALSRGEAQTLSHAGIDVVSIHELTGTELRGGYHAGEVLAHEAEAAVRSLHLPSDRPVYFTADFDAQGAQLEYVAEGIRGAVSVLGWARVGIYGGIAVIEHLHALNRCKFYWQTLAWSGGRWSPHAQLRQVQNGRRIGGADCDIDKAMAHDFGQWRV